LAAVAVAVAAVATVVKASVAAASTVSARSVIVAGEGGTTADASEAGAVVSRDCFLDICMERVTMHVSYTRKKQEQSMRFERTDSTLASSSLALPSLYLKVHHGDSFPERANSSFLSLFCVLLGALLHLLKSCIDARLVSQEERQHPPRPQHRRTFEARQGQPEDQQQLGMVITREPGARADTYTRDTDRSVCMLIASN
jgi:hypothetical protein